MAQYLKEAVKIRIHDAARDVFFKQGFKGAKMADIAQSATVATGNIYKYYKNKSALFDAIITDTFRATFMQILRDRVDALSSLHSANPQLDQVNAFQEQLLTFWITHRRETVIILARSEGSRFENFAAFFVDELVRLAMAEVSQVAEHESLLEEYAFTLRRVFENTVQTIVTILSDYEDELEIRRMFKLFWTYHIAGLNSLIGR